MPRDLCVERLPCGCVCRDAAGNGFAGTLQADDRRLVETAGMAFLVAVVRTSGMTREGEAFTQDIRSTTAFRK